MIPGYDEWKLRTPEDDADSFGPAEFFDEDSREDEDDFEECGQFYDGQ